MLFFGIIIGILLSILFVCVLIFLKSPITQVVNKTEQILYSHSPKQKGVILEDEIEQEDRIEQLFYADKS